MKILKIKIKPTKIKALILLWVFQLIFIVLPISDFIGFLKPPVAHAANANGRVVYGLSTNAAPRERAWDGSAFGTESSAATATANIQWVVNQEAPGRAENVIGTGASTGNISFQVRSSGSWGNLISVGAVGTTNDAQRSFDVAYEQISGDAMVVYEKDTTSDKAVYYQTWNGTSWSGENTLTYSSGSNGNSLWGRLEAKPLTDEIMFISEDNNSDIRGIVWDGSSWTNEQLLTTAATSATTTLVFDVAYEYTSKDALVAYGTGTTWNFWTYSAGTWTNGTGGSNCTGDGTTNNCSNVAGAVIDLELTGSSENNYIGVSIGETTGDDFTAQMWDGSQWLSTPQAISLWDEAGATENVAGTHAIAGGYENNGNRFMFAYVLNGALNAVYFFYDLDTSTWYNGDGTTSITDIDSATTTTPSWSDDVEWIRLTPNPDDASQIMLSGNDLLFSNRSFLWSGSSWSTPTNSTHGAAAAALMNTVYFAWDRTIPVHTIGTSGSQSSPLIIPSTNQHVGGAFTAVLNTGSAQNITSIVITEQGSVNANSNLSNVILFYKQEATCSSTIPGDATQWNTTGASFNASEKATVTGDSAMSVGTSQVCIYVRLNVGSGASDGQTMEIEISNPSTEVSSAASAVAPASAVAISGQTTLEVPAITVGTTGSQASPLGIPSGDNNVGGAFTFIRNTASANVTQIIVTDTGSVNANANISDVVLFYKQEGSCSASIPGDATQFNSTPGTFNVSEKSTVTGTIAVGTSQICVYVRIDVAADASDTQTFEIEITNPSTEVTASAGIVKPGTAVARTGTSTLNIPTYTSYGQPFLYTQANWAAGAGLNFYFEVYWRLTAGSNVYARVYDETSSSAVSSSIQYTSSGTFTRSRTGALALTDGHLYRAQLGKLSGGAGETYGAKLLTRTDGGGADLAEYYQSPETLDLGEVVAVDPNRVASVVRTTKSYQADTIGIVSTKPGMILGMNIGQSYPIALAGRVPVKFSSENGLVKSGDRLTAASIPGYAMKATKAGRVIGTALESFDPAKATACPSTSRATNAKPACGSVEVFVNLSDYQGQSLGAVIADGSSPGFVAVEDFGATSGSSGPTVLSLPGAELDDASRRAAERYSQQLSRSQELLSYFRQIDEDQPAFDSDIFTGELAASERIITPQVVTDELITKRIRADQIEGLSLIIESVAARAKTPVANTSEVSSPDNQLAVSVGLDTIGNLDFSKSKAIFSDVRSVSLTVLARLESQGGLLVSGDSEFKGQVLFRLLSTFEGPTDFKQPQLLSSDSGGIVTIKKDELEVEVKFKQDYPLKPLITASYYFEGKDGKDDLAAQQAYNKAGYRFVVTKISQTGFTIVLNQPATADMRFSWLAVAVKEETTTGQL